MIRNRLPSLVLATVMLMTSCSLTGMRTLPDNPSRAEVERCDSSSLAPSFDAAWSAMYLGQSIFLYSWIFVRLDNAAGRDERPVLRDLSVVPLVIMAAVHGYSAIDGFHEAARCREEKRALLPAPSPSFGRSQ